MTWEIALGIIALAGFLITTGSLAARIASTLARLEVSLKELSAAVLALKNENSAEHRAMDQALTAHERRITIMEAQTR